MTLIVVVILIVLLLGGGGYSYSRRADWGPAPIGIVSFLLILLLIYLLFTSAGTHF